MLDMSAWSTRTKSAIFFAIAYFLLAIAPFLLVYYWPKVLPNLVETVFVDAFRKYGFEWFPLGAVVAALCFYLLKLRHRAVYGAIEIFVAAFTIATAISALDKPERTATALLQILGGVYITVRGFDNVREGLAELESHPAAKYLWSEYFAEDILGVRMLSLVLGAVCIVVLMRMPYGVFWFSITYSALLVITDIFVQRIRDKRRGVVSAISPPTNRPIGP